MSNPRVTEPTNAEYISKIVDPARHTHYIRDAWARGEIDYLRELIKGGTTFLGVTTTPLTDGSTTATIIINGESVTVTAEDSGAIVLYNKPSGSSGSSTLEFIWDGGAWREFGTQGLLGALAYKDSASGSYTPSGTIEISAITLSGSAKFTYQPEGSVTGSVTAQGSSKFTYQPEGTVTVSGVKAAGTVSKPDITVTPTTESLSYLSDVTYDSTTETLTINNVSGKSVMTGASAALASAPTFDGTTVTPTATFTGTAVTNGTTQVTFEGTEVSISASFVGTAVTEGTTQVDFEGITVTPTATFTGTTATITVS